MLEMDLRSGYAPVTVSFPSSSATTETAQPPGLALASFGSSVPSRVHCSSRLLPQVCSSSTTRFQHAARTAVQPRARDAGRLRA